jgi:5-methylcytosine-specific restriction endonuclease McrA
MKREKTKGQWRAATERRNGYTSAFSKEFKLAILIRDNYTCVLCGAQCGQDQKESLQKPCAFVHHANYDKSDTRPDNCVTVCGSCHSKIHHHEAKYLDLIVSIARQCAKGL